MLLPQTPSFSLQGKRALVTGAGRGIGRAAAVALADAGADVRLCARTHSDVAEVAHALTAQGREAEAVSLDVNDIQSVRAYVSAEAPFDVLVNSAGTNRPKEFLDVTESDYDAVMELNVRSAYFITQAVASRLVEAKRGGSIIHVSSQMGHVGAARRTIYCASKWALEGLTRAMAVELARHSIRVNSLAPTFIETPMTKPFLDNSAFKAEVLSKIKLARLGTVEDLMGGILYLASDASALMTGASLLIDGGWTAD